MDAFGSGVAKAVLPLREQVVYEALLRGGGRDGEAGRCRVAPPERREASEKHLCDETGMTSTDVRRCIGGLGSLVHTVEGGRRQGAGARWAADERDLAAVASRFLGENGAGAPAAGSSSDRGGRADPHSAEMAVAAERVRALRDAWRSAEEEGEGREVRPAAARAGREAAAASGGERGATSRGRHDDDVLRDLAASFPLGRKAKAVDEAYLSAAVRLSQVGKAFYVEGTGGRLFYARSVPAQAGSAHAPPMSVQAAWKTAAAEAQRDGMRGGKGRRGGEGRADEEGEDWLGAFPKKKKQKKKKTREGGEESGEREEGEWRGGRAEDAPAGIALPGSFSSLFA